MALGCSTDNGQLSGLGKLTLATDINTDLGCLRITDLDLAGPWWWQGPRHHQGFRWQHRLLTSLCLPPSPRAAQPSRWLLFYIRTTDPERAPSSIMDQAGHSRRPSPHLGLRHCPKPGVPQGQVERFRGRVHISSRLLHPHPHPNHTEHFAVSLSPFLHSSPPSHVSSPVCPQEAGGWPFEGGCSFSN